jgi:hypothetical protein
MLGFIKLVLIVKLLTNCLNQIRLHMCALYMLNLKLALTFQNGMLKVKREAGGLAVSMY